MATQVMRQQATQVIGKAGFLSKVAGALWRVSSGLSLASLFLPIEPAFRHSNAISLKDKAEVDAYLMGFNRPG